MLLAKLSSRKTFIVRYCHRAKLSSCKVFSDFHWESYLVMLHVTRPFFRDVVTYLVKLYWPFHTVIVRVTRSGRCCHLFGQVTHYAVILHGYLVTLYWPRVAPLRGRFTERVVHTHSYFLLGRVHLDSFVCLIARGVSV